MELVSVRLSPDGDGVRVTDRDSDSDSVTSFRLSDLSNVRVICQCSQFAGYWSNRHSCTEGGYPAAAFAAAPAAAADWPFLGQISGSQCTCEAVWFIYLRVTQGIMTSKQRLASCTATGGRPQCPDQPLAMFRGPAHTGAGRRPN